MSLLPPRDSMSGELPRGTETVLIVDEHPIVRLTLARILRGLGYKVLEARDAMAAGRLRYQSPAIHIVLAHFAVAKKGAMEMARAFCAMYSGTPVLVVSGSLWELAGQADGIEPLPEVARPFTSKLARMIRTELAMGSSIS